MSSDHAGDPLDPEIERVAEAVVRAGRRLGARGLIAAGEGNISVRLPRERLLVTPSGLRKDELTPSDLLTVHIGRDGAGDSGRSSGPATRELRPTSDLAIHRAIMAARRDVVAIAHAHLPAAMAFTLAGESPDPAALPETALLLPRLPVVPFGAPGSEDLARRIAEALAEPPEPLPGAAILERHGALALGGVARSAERVAGHEDRMSDPAGEAWVEEAIKAVGQAFDRLELIEVLCRATRDSLLLRAARRRAEVGRGRV